VEQFRPVIEPSILFQNAPLRLLKRCTGSYFSGPLRLNSVMFKKLSEKWKVGPLQLTLILCTFAFGGSATGWVAKKIMNSLGLQQDVVWATVYILLITLLWPLMVLVISIPFGQFRFFQSYIRKLIAKLGFLR
jgi:hypothetical protein